MRGTLGGLYCRRNLGIRGREQTHDLLGQGLVGREAGELALPQIEIAPCQTVEIAVRTGLRDIVFGRHDPTITHGGQNGLRTRKGLLVALRYRR